MAGYKEKFKGLAGSVLGNVGSREQMNAICAAAYTGSHLCHVAEYYRAASAATLPAGGAWADGCGFVGTSTWEQTIHVAPVNVGRYIAANSNYNCQGWTSATNFGASVAPGGPAVVACNVARPVACCQ